MRRLIFILLLVLATAGSTLAAGTETHSPTDKKAEWTFLIFLNGNNNLDFYGEENIKQMEQVGSTENINIVVQWASFSTGKVKRLLIKKDSGVAVGSPIVETLPKTDMGDWKSVVEFVKWGAKNYPAQHYFLELWDHGSGWHEKNGSLNPSLPQIMDISQDDISGNHITTKQLGLALKESAKAIGHKIDLFATDACLMAMPEITNEMADSVEIYAGSEEIEPEAGWPYDQILSRWSNTPKASAIEVAKIVSEEYVKKYSGEYDRVTYSVFDLAHLPAFNRALKAFGKSIQKLDLSGKKKVLEAASQSLAFATPDYVDFLDFTAHLKSEGVNNLSQSSLSAVSKAAQKLIVSNHETNLENATGLSIWIPIDAETYDAYSKEYSALQFDVETNWGNTLKSLFK